MASVKNFSYQEALRFGWETTKKNFWFILAVLLINYGVQALFSFLSGYFYSSGEEGGNIFPRLIINIAGYIVGLELSIASIKIGLNFVDKKKSEISDLIAYFQTGLIFNYFIITIVQGLIFLAGLILFIIPGIYWGIKYCFAPYVFLDKGITGWEAFQKSAEITNGVKWRLFGFGILSFFITLAGLLAFVAGLLVAIPVVYLANIYIYRKLSTHIQKS